MPDPRLRFPDRLRALFAPKFNKVNPPPPPARPEDMTTSHERAAEAALRGEVERVRTARPGTRNHQLFCSAAALGNLVGFGCLDETYATAALMSAAAECGLIDDDGFAACRKTIEGGISTGKTTPRDPAPKATAQLRRRG
jgi:hypothetical protein